VNLALRVERDRVLDQRRAVFEHLMSEAISTR